MKEASIISLYDSFLHVLQKEKKKIVLLQFVGRIEDYFTKEFIYHIYDKSKQRFFAYANYGSDPKRKIDIVVFDRSFKKPDRKVIGLIELKYLHNEHRDSGKKANDDIGVSLKSLHGQLSFPHQSWFGEYPVELKTRGFKIYGLVLASFVSRTRNANDKKRKKEFYQTNIGMHKMTKKFRYHDYKHFYLHTIYDDVEVNILGKPRFATLKAGLLVLKNNS